MDNRVFNVNGSGSSFLLETLKLAFAQKDLLAEAWLHSDEKGMLILWHKEDSRAHRLPGRLTAEQILPLVEAYLQSEEAKSVKCEGWDADHDHDGHNNAGWRVYVEDWGNVDGYYTICAVRPAFMWLGR